MAAPHPSPQRACQAKPVTRTRLQRPRRPRRCGRLLVLGLNVALVAALGTRALADPDGDGLLAAAADSQTEQPQTATESQQLAASNLGSADDDSAVTRGDPAQLLNGQEHPQLATVPQDQTAHRRAGQG